MSSVSVQEMVTRANRLLADGDFSQARTLAQQAYALDKNNSDVLVLVSKVITDKAKQRALLEKALLIDPAHREARKLLNALNGIIPPPIVEPPVIRIVRPRRTLQQWIYGIIGLIFICGCISTLGVGLLGNVINSLTGFRSTPNAAALQPTASVATSPAVAVSVPSVTIVPVAATLPPVQSAVPPNNSGSSDPLVMTATALQQGLVATSVSLTQMAGNVAQSAALTQTATQQGALGATVAAQQTAIAASNTLPGTLIVNQPIDGLLSNKVQYVLNGKIGGVPSPDGKNVVYQATTGLIIAHLDGSNQKPVMNGSQPFSSSHNSWSPDGQWIVSGAYLTNINDGIAHLVLPSGLMLLSSGDGFDQSIAWSPNHKQVAVLATDANYTQAEVLL